MTACARRNGRGFILLVVLFLMVVGFLLGISYTTYVASQGRQSASHEYATQGLYVAIAGLQYGMNLVRNPERFVEWTTACGEPTPPYTPPSQFLRLEVEIAGGRVGRADFRWCRIRDPQDPNPANLNAAVFWVTGQVRVGAVRLTRDEPDLRPVLAERRLEATVTSMVDDDNTPLTPPSSNWTKASVEEVHFDAR